MLPPFKVGREWISHYTSCKYSEVNKDSLNHTGGVDEENFGTTLGIDTSHASLDNTKFASDILITYKLKNPSQFLRDVFHFEDMTEFASRFDPHVPLYLMTGYKVSRNVQTALEQQDTQSNSVKFHLSNRVKIIPTPLGDLAVPNASIGDDQNHKTLSTIDYQAPGDSIFFVRYHRIAFEEKYPNVLILPANPISWGQWLSNCCTGRAKTVIMKDDTTAIQTAFTTAKCLTSTIRTISTLKRLPLTGRHSTLESCDDSELIQAVSRCTTETSVSPGQDSSKKQASTANTENTPLLRVAQSQRRG